MPRIPTSHRRCSWGRARAQAGIHGEPAGAVVAGGDHVQGGEFDGAGHVAGGDDAAHAPVGDHRRESVAGGQQAGGRVDEGSTRAQGIAPGDRLRVPGQPHGVPLVLGRGRARSG